MDQVVGGVIAVRVVGAEDDGCVIKVVGALAVCRGLGSGSRQGNEGQGEENGENVHDENLKKKLKFGFLIFFFLCRGFKMKCRLQSLIAVDMFRHFGPRILNAQIKSPFLTENMHF